MYVVMKKKIVQIPYVSVLILNVELDKFLKWLHTTISILNRPKYYLFPKGFNGIFIMLLTAINDHKVKRKNDLETIQNCFGIIVKKVMEP